MIRISEAAIFSFILVLFLSGACSAPGQLAGDDVRPDITEEDYRRAEKLLSWNVNSSVLRSNIRPEWIDNDRFWYRTRTENGFRFYLVDPDGPVREAAFNHESLAAALEKVLDKTISPGQLPFSDFRFTDDETGIIFNADNQLWKCRLSDYSCEKSEKPSQPDNSLLSPDRRWAAFIRDHNLWVRDMASGEDFALTTTGEKHYGFAINSQGWFRSDRPVLNWSPDSRKIATYRLDERGVGEMHLLKTSHDRPELDSWPYALPGDTVVPMMERVVLDVASQSKIWLDVEPSHQRTSNCCGLERGDQWTDIEWSADASKLAFVTTSRDYREVDLYIADTQSGDVRHVYHESAETFFESNLTSRGEPNWRMLFDRNEFIWFSRRDEWGHLYLHRLENGAQIDRITSGEWNVVDLLHADKRGGNIYFTAVGKEADRDPYHEHLYKVSLSGNSADSPDQWNTDERIPELLTPEQANHQIHVSPSGRYFVDEFSSYQEASVTKLRSADGSDVLSLEASDITKLLETGWTAPEPFVVKARDNETDLYGILIKPSHFDPANRYPVIVSIYPGPQIGSVGTRNFAPARRGQSHALAELGFVVVHIDALGTPLRSKSFHTAWYGDMSDNGIEDQIAGIRQLAERYEWLDSDRAGIFGHSGGGYATASALLRHPGVFKAGVASAGNMDNRGYTYYWGEKYHGQRVQSDGEDSFEPQAIQELAGNLDDHLLISYGTLDDNVHPNMTLLFIDELIKENKDFDLIVMPNRNHGYANEAYHVRRTWDFFVRHLLEVKPPREFTIN